MKSSGHFLCKILGLSQAGGDITSYNDLSIKIDHHAEEEDSYQGMETLISDTFFMLYYIFHVL